MDLNSFIKFEMILKAELNIVAEGLKKGDKGLTMEDVTKTFQTTKYVGNEQQKVFTEPHLFEICQLFDRVESDGHRTRSRHGN